MITTRKVLNWFFLVCQSSTINNLLIIYHIYTVHYTASGGFLYASDYAVKYDICNPQQFLRLHRKLIFGLSL